MYSIAIDGPAGSGKSSIAKGVARNLNIDYVDTGAMFRAITLKIIENNNELNHLNKILEDTELDFNEGKIYLDGVDVSKKIRSETVSNLSSKYSQIPEVRHKLLLLQQEIASKNNVVMEGRDIGTVVLPNAKYKFFLTASPETRAKRRQLQLREKGVEEPLDKILKDIVHRDKNDSNRQEAPLKEADDAIRIDNSHLNYEETLELILSHIKEG